jgi:hypothetical protein
LGPDKLECLNASTPQCLNASMLQRLNVSKLQCADMTMLQTARPPVRQSAKAPQTADASQCGAIRQCGTMHHDASNRGITKEANHQSRNTDLQIQPADPASMDDPLQNAVSCLQKPAKIKLTNISL